MPAFLWAASACPLVFVSSIESTLFAYAVAALAAAGLKWEMARTLLIGATFGAGFAYAAEAPLVAGVIAGAGAGFLFRRSNPVPNQPVLLRHAGPGFLAGTALLALGPFLPIEWICAWLGSFSLSVALRGTRRFWFAAMLTGVLTFVVGFSYTRPRTFLFYNQIHATALGLFNRIEVDSTSLGVEAFRGPGGRIFLGTSEAWISDGGRYIENPALSPVRFALRWQQISGADDGLYYGGAVTPELCERFKSDKIHYLESDLTFFAGDCPLEKPGEMRAYRHLMIYQPLDSALIAQDPSDTTDGKWSRWDCSVTTMAKGRAFMKTVETSATASVYSIQFRSAHCEVRVGAGMVKPEKMEEDPVLARYLLLEGAS